MTRSQIGLAISAAGIVFLFLAVSGAMGTISPPVAVLAALAVLVGLALILHRLGGVALCRPHTGVIVVAALAVALHVYENLLKSSGEFSPGALVWASMPYALCLVVSSYSATRLAAIAGALVALSFDLLAYYAVFVNPTSSTAALALLFVPLWNTFVFAPVATGATWLLLRRRDRHIQHAP